jgi:hypothetical protein
MKNQRGLSEEKTFYGKNDPSMIESSGVTHVIIVYLLVTYGTRIHKARHSVLAYLVTRNPFTLLLGCE